VHGVFRWFAKGGEFTQTANLIEAFAMISRGKIDKLAFGAMLWLREDKVVKALRETPQPAMWGSHSREPPHGVSSHGCVAHRRYGVSSHGHRCRGRDAV
jgi:hypothetical protein